MALDFNSLGIDRLTVSERWALVDFILEGMPQQAVPIQLSPGQMAEIERRCAAADADPHVGRPWREVIDEIRKEL